MHPTDDELQSMFDGELRPEAQATVQGHVETCNACSSRLAALRALRHRLRTPVGPSVSDAVWLNIRHTMSGRIHRVAPSPLLAAAAVVLFVAGYGIGRAQPRPKVQRPVADVASEVQRTGSAYVGALAMLATLPETNPDRRAGREAALGAFRGTAVELTRLGADHDMKAALERAVNASSTEARVPRHVIHF